MAPQSVMALPTQPSPGVISSWQALFNRVGTPRCIKLRGVPDADSDERQGTAAPGAPHVERDLPRDRGRLLSSRRRESLRTIPTTFCAAIVAQLFTRYR